MPKGVMGEDQGSDSVRFCREDGRRKGIDDTLKRVSYWGGGVKKNR
jgi:hypothetical protein